MPRARHELAQRLAVRTESGPDDPGAGRRAAEEDRAPGHEGDQDRVTEPGVGGDEPAERVPRHHDHLTGLHRAGGHEDAHAGEQVELADELARTVLRDDLLLGAVVGHDLDRPRHHDVEVVGHVTLAEEVLAGGHRAPRPQLVQDGQVGIGQRRKGGLEVIGHGRASSGLWQVDGSRRAMNWDNPRGAQSRSGGPDQSEWGSEAGNESSSCPSRYPSLGLALDLVRLELVRLVLWCRAHARSALSIESARSW